MSTNPGHEGALPHEEHGAHEDAGIGRFFFGRVPEGVHGGLKQYGILAIFLAVVTLVEFLIIVPEGLQGSGIVIAPLVILSVIKFFCVVAFFMHLKFEHELLWQIFVAGLALGLVVALSLVLLFGVFRPTPREFSEPRQQHFEHHVAEAHHEYEPLVIPTPCPVGACPPPQAPGTATSGSSPGESLFIGAGACSSCHTISGVAQGVLGPPLDGIGSAAANRIPGYSAEEYIRESIIEPDAYAAGTADGLSQDYDGNLMLSTMAGVLPSLSDEDIETLVEYLLSLQ